MKSILSKFGKFLSNRVLSAYKSTIIGIILIAYAIKHNLDSNYDYAALVIGIVLVLGKWDYFDKLIGIKKEDKSVDN